MYAVQSLTKRYRQGKLANDGLVLELRQGEILGVFGPNGAGKTTLVRQMVGLLRPTSGSILLYGRDVLSNPGIVPPAVAYFSQRVAALGTFRFREVLLQAGVLRGMTPSDAAREAEDLIDRFDCREFHQRFLFQLSGGERRLALLLATFMSLRPVLVLDEPSNDLDPHRRRLMWQYLLAANRDKGTSILLVTHNVAEAEQIVDRVLIVDGGRIRASGTPGELKSRFGSTARVYVALKAGAEPIGLLAQAKHLHGLTWCFLVPEHEVVQLLSGLMDSVGLGSLDRFWVTSCSLEDVYVAVTGRDWEDVTQGSA